MLRAGTPEKQELSQLHYCCLTSGSYESAAVPGTASALLSELMEKKKTNNNKPNHNCIGSFNQISLQEECAVKLGDIIWTVNYVPGNSFQEDPVDSRCIRPKQYEDEMKPA